MKKGLLFVAVIAALLTLSGCSSSENEYESAMEQMESGDYASALDTLNEIADYEDAADKIAECKYELACEAMEGEDWDSAISYLEDLDFEDSEELLLVCTKKKGMSENDDYDFLAAIEESILSRMNSDEDDYLVLVNIELAYLEEYEDASFYDEELEAICDRYLEGLYLQKESLSEEYESDYQIKWLRGRVYRDESLCALYENYDFLTDNAEFIGTYISQAEDNAALLAAYDAIEADIIAQLESDDFVFYLDDYWAHFTLTNNTEYSFSTVFELQFMDGDDAILEEYSVYVENISAGSTYEVSTYASDPDRLENYHISNYYTDVNY